MLQQRFGSHIPNGTLDSIFSYWKIKLKKKWIDAIEFSKNEMGTTRFLAISNNIVLREKWLESDGMTKPLAQNESDQIILL